jgi:hypothetical protein
VTLPTPPDPITASVRSLDTDWLLDLLTSMANAGDFTVAVTLWTPAGIVSGDLVGSPAWIRELRAGVRASGDVDAQRFADDLQSVEDHITRGAVQAQQSPEPLSYLHLRNATTLLPGGETFRHGLWRGRFVDVTGWTLGKV